MVCLDTDILIDFLKQRDYAIKIIKELQRREENLSTTSINTFELYKGVVKSNNQEALIPLNNLLTNLKILNFNFINSKKAAEIFENLKTKGELLDLADIMIASIAISNNESLLTNNISHFKRIPELKLEKI